MGQASIVRPGGEARGVVPARAPTRGVGWRPWLANRFLDHLAETCDVEASARRIGIVPSRIYRRLRSDPAFAAAWAAAVNAAYLTIETRMIADVLSEGEAKATESAATLAWDRGFRLLQQRGTRGGARGKAEAAVPAIATRDETDKAIEERLARLAARKAAGGRA